MAITLFGIKKKLLENKLKKAMKKSDKLSKLRAKEAKEARELKKLKDQIVKASKIKISPQDKKVLKMKSDELSAAQKRRKESLKNTIMTAKKAGKIGAEFGRELSSFVGTGKRKRSKTSKRRKRLY